MCDAGAFVDNAAKTNLDCHTSGLLLGFLLIRSGGLMECLSVTSSLSSFLTIRPAVSKMVTKRSSFILRRAPTYRPFLHLRRKVIPTPLAVRLPPPGGGQFAYLIMNRTSEKCRTATKRLFTSCEVVAQMCFTITW